MKQVNIVEAKNNLSKLIHILELKNEEYITIARNGKPVAKLTLLSTAPVENRIGMGKDKFNITGDFDADNDVISDMLAGEKLRNNIGP